MKTANKINGSFYNTINQTGKELKESLKKASNQCEKIMVFFKANPKKMFTPFDIKYIGLFEDNVPLTSIRRAMTDLEQQGLLEKTDTQREGGYGKMNYCWKLYVSKKKSKKGQQIKLFL